MDARVEKWARVLVDYSLRLKAGDYLVVESTPLAEPLIREAFRQAVRRGAHVDVRLGLPGLSRLFYTEASDEQLRFISPIRRLVIERADATLSISAPFNVKELTGVDPARLAAASAAAAPLMQTFMERSASGSLRWCLTNYPTHALAQEAAMSLDEYAEFVFAAGLLDANDPVAAWQEQSRRQAALIAVLERAQELRVVAEDTDLRVGVAGRRWVNADGSHNFPDGEVFTGPVEDAVEGTIRFTYPAIHLGREVVDVRLTFERGRVVEARAAQGEDLLRALLDTDEGARRVGEFAIGMNYGITRFTKSTLFDEKIGGTVHLALGAGYPETGSTNRSAIHWDLVCDLRRGGELYADGRLILRDGKLVEGAVP